MGRGLFQPMHLLVVLAIALLVFGPKRLPEIGKGLGGAIRGFKDVFKGGEATQAKSETKALPDTKGPGESSDQSKN
jgi:sec-independent protein translocase protein TatA